MGSRYPHGLSKLAHNKSKMVDGRHFENVEKIAISHERFDPIATKLCIMMHNDLAVIPTVKNSRKTANYTSAESSSFLCVRVRCVQWS